ncbi:hypothetical protein GCM10009543_30440 [Leifsonia naganoensis]|jgi:hypothetical protein
MGYFSDLIRRDEWARTPASIKYPFAAFIAASLLTITASILIGWPGPLWREGLAALVGYTAGAIVRACQKHRAKRSPSAPGKYAGATCRGPRGR